MKTSFRYFLVSFSTVFLIAFGLSSATAQQRMDPEVRVKELITALEISAEQEPAFREAMTGITTRQREAMRGMMQQGGAGSGQGMARMAEMREQAEKDLTPVLTEAQMAKYRELERERMQQMRQRMPGG